MTAACAFPPQSQFSRKSLVLRDPSARAQVSAILFGWVAISFRHVRVREQYDA